MTYDLIVLGMGSGGMLAAKFAATLDLKVLVIEKHRVGGDCLWTGCVPSKALLAAAKTAHHMRTADRFGITAVEPIIDRATVWEKVREVQRAIAATDDNPERFRAEGIELLVGEAGRIVGPNTVAVGETMFAGRYILVATGSRPLIPSIAGLAEVGYLTSENLFELIDPPGSLVIIGGGPIAVEMAQACRRLGMEVTVLQKADRLLPRDEPSLVDMLVDQLRSEGVQVHVNVETTAVRVEGGVKIVSGKVGGVSAEWGADELLVAAGRTPNVEGLGLAEVGVDVGPRGVEVDNRMRTAVSTIYAAGDVAGRFLFTHSAGYEAVRAVRDAFFPGKGTFTALVPWCTFTDPELAHAGMTVADAQAKFGADDVHVWELPLSHNDRGRADRANGGIVLVTGPKGRLVGGHILAPAAGEMIHELAFAIHDERKLSDLSHFVHVYPTIGTAIGQLAAEAVFESAKKYRWLVKRK